MKFIIAIIILLSALSCGPTTTGNPIKPVTLRMEDRQPLAFLRRTSDFFIPEARAAVSNTKFCFKRLRFKPDEFTAGSNIDLTIGQVDIDPAGTNLLTVSVPEGVYERIEFDLDKDCDGVPGKPSVIFTNGNGTFSTNDSMTIKFNGSFRVGSTETLTLDIDALLDALDPLNNGAGIKAALESALGDF